MLKLYSEKNKSIRAVFIVLNYELLPFVKNKVKNQFYMIKV